MFHNIALAYDAKTPILSSVLLCIPLIVFLCCILSIKDIIPYKMNIT